MDDKVKVLFPDRACSLDNTSAEDFATMLERTAAEIRSGERRPQYGMFLYMDENSRSYTLNFGDITKHQAILLTDLAHVAAIEDLYNRG